jgi:hypothetical protein
VPVRPYRRRQHRRSPLVITLLLMIVILSVWSQIALCLPAVAAW